MSKSNSPNSNMEERKVTTVTGAVMASEANALLRESLRTVIIMQVFRFIKWIVSRLC
jgi:hypothetical protein